jgi:predicted ATPase
MTGVHHVVAKNRDANFKFDLHRNITIVRGNSGTGKTTLFDMISDYTRLKDASGVNISCDKECVALVDIDWRNQLKNVSDSIVFIDEGAEYLRTKEFAEAIKNTDNYYVIFNRESLHELPYSVEEIYEIKTSGKYHSLKKMYKSNDKHVYSKGKVGSKPI